MSENVTYPGVYVEEVPTGVRTISGVSTSTTAFVGRAARGPVDEPVVLTSYGEFERRFGGLWLESNLGFAVRDFFLNGGSSAAVVRVHHSGDGPDVAELRFGTSSDELMLQASSPGSWGSLLNASATPRPDDAVDSTLFDLTVTDTGTGHTEMYDRLSLMPESPRRVDAVLAAESALVRAVEPLPTVTPNGTSAAKIVGDGQPLDASAFIGDGARDGLRGLYALENLDLFNLLVIPAYLSSGDVDAAVLAEALALCERRRSLAILDAPASWTTIDAARAGAEHLQRSKNGAVYFPRLRRPNPLRADAMETFGAAGAVAGVMARTDAARGVWKAPAGVEATLIGSHELALPLTDDEIGLLNPLGVNCLRRLPSGLPVIWGARTLQGADFLASEWKYVPVRRTALFIEESLRRGTQWVVFEQNGEPLWAQIRLNVGAFMDAVFRAGAFQGTTPRDAYFVKCDADTTTRNDIDKGLVNIVVGFAPLKPAEFVVITIRQRMNPPR